jgi:hypothetical protein
LLGSSTTTSFSEWFKSFKHLSTSVLIDVLNFLPGNKKATRRTISARWELWLLCRRIQMKVFDRRRRWHFPRSVLEVFVFNRRRTRPFSPWCPGVLGLEQEEEVT